MYVSKLKSIYKINVHKIIFVYTASELSSTCVFDLASFLIHFTGVPLGYYFYICSTKVRQSVYIEIIFCIFFICRSLWNMRNYIHCMLCGSMFTAQLLYTFGINRTENEVL